MRTGKRIPMEKYDKTTGKGLGTISEIPRLVGELERNNLI